MSQDASPGIAKTSPRENAQSASVPRTGVLGRSQPSLRDSSSRWPNPGLASWTSVQGYFQPSLRDWTSFQLARPVLGYSRTSMRGLVSEDSSVPAYDSIPTRRRRNNLRETHHPLRQQTKHRNTTRGPNINLAIRDHGSNKLVIRKMIPAVRRLVAVI